MSSEIGANLVIASGVVTGVVLIGAGAGLAGAGKIAVKSGKLLWKINSNIDRTIEEKKKKLEEEAFQREQKAENIQNRFTKMYAKMYSDNSENLFDENLEFSIPEEPEALSAEDADEYVMEPVFVKQLFIDEELTSVAERIMNAVENAAYLEKEYGLSTSNRAWIQSSLNSVDMRIRNLCRPDISDTELKKGIRRLENIMEQYEILIPDIEREQIKIAEYYEVYAEMSKMLGEPIVKRNSIKNLSELEERLTWLEGRLEKARECAEIYKKLGQSAYISYAYDTELKALGYNVHTRKEISAMAGYTPQHAKLGENKIPFYEWAENELTQLYSVAEECDLQVVVNKDGTVSMQTLSSSEDTDAVRQTQKVHCKQMRHLHEQLKKNWFITFDYQENVSADEIKTIAQWRREKQLENGLITDMREKEQTESLFRYL